MNKKTKTFNRFAYVYSLIQGRHPNWHHKQIAYCTLYAIKGNKRWVK